MTAVQKKESQEGNTTRASDESAMGRPDIFAMERPDVFAMGRPDVIATADAPKLVLSNDVISQGLGLKSIWRRYVSSTRLIWGVCGHKPAQMTALLCNTYGARKVLSYKAMNNP